MNDWRTTGAADIARQIATGLREALEQEWKRPAGWCVNASNRLVKRLRQAGLTATLVRGHFHAGWDDETGEEVHISHAYVEVAGGEETFMVDITADQFNEYGFDFPPVHLFLPGEDLVYA